MSRKRPEFLLLLQVCGGKCFRFAVEEVISFNPRRELISEDLRTRLLAGHNITSTMIFIVL